MRIVSLLPSATEIVCLLGLRDSLVGRSHECDYPPEVADVPVMTYSSIGVTGDDGTINPALTSAEIDARVSQRLRDGLSLYGLHTDRLDAAKPDLILTQELCDVCAVSYATVRAVVRDLSHKWEGSAQVVSLEPTDIEGIFQTILTVGELTGTNAVAKARVQALRDRLERVREALAGIVHRPTVAALEWLDPPFAPGHWVPEQIEIAGGNPVLGRKGKPSFRCAWEDVARTQAECVIAMPCGFDLAGSVREFQNAAAHEIWRDLPATYLWQLYAVDATSYFSRPGPRVVDGVEILAGLLHPNRWPAPGPAHALRVNDFIPSWHPTR
ncbi:MAG: cobalamin-binding protein [Chloroflexi bacterium]|jgi:iron complex transport system substrate-binding protein|uniref:Cobalamin-binding protein n=1 Tax=Candidatus Thermofonsia Clade 3 bacterium TaxID=2364212 RepID=A0A2M8QEG8_9CHLR|nr:cobalamin-binding protein [Candidatus Roseilinea sp. NK_OTU-006]PJF48194.1 MAG: cobalamin-binding protein [Candidatus Thermofonsia Clade 3 bacterium]RMG65025.1 MAG: cobalamin-binding protein [Chloroflexota bacterium]